MMMMCVYVCDFLKFVKVTVLQVANIIILQKPQTNKILDLLLPQEFCHFKN